MHHTPVAAGAVAITRRSTPKSSRKRMHIWFVSPLRFNFNARSPVKASRVKAVFLLSSDVPENRLRRNILLIIFTSTKYFESSFSSSSASFLERQNLHHLLKVNRMVRIGALVMCVCHLAHMHTRTISIPVAHTCKKLLMAHVRPLKGNLVLCFLFRDCHSYALRPDEAALGES